jgi:hypothetical protein
MGGRSLAGLVAEARERYIKEAGLTEWLRGQLHPAPPEVPGRAAKAICWLADEWVRLAEAGVYSGFHVCPLPNESVLLEWVPAEVFWEDLFGWRLDDCPNWEKLEEVCGLASDIDSFLATLERGPGRELARGCRQDVDGLAVLADWCEENGLPAAAAEARHLHGLVRRALT